VNDNYFCTGVFVWLFLIAAVGIIYGNIQLVREIRGTYKSEKGSFTEAWQGIALVFWLVVVSVVVVALTTALGWLMETIL